MIDLYTALELCSKEDYIMLYGAEYTKTQIVKKFDLRKIKVRKIYFNKRHNVMRFETGLSKE